jgi:hypothetical protein
MTTITNSRVREPGVAIEEAETARPRNLTLLVLVAALTTLIGIGIGWLIFRDTGASVPADVDALLDDYHAAWADHDGAAVLATMVHGGVVSVGGSETASGDLLATFVDESPTLSVEDGDIVGVFGDTTTVVVEEATVGSVEGFSVFHIVNQFDEPRIANHTWLGS